MTRNTFNYLQPSNSWKIKFSGWCWENEDGMNRASCFGCTMVSETSCEQANMALDRRVLVDEEFGFFKDLI